MTEIQIPIRLIRVTGGGGLIGRVLIGSDDPAVNPDCGSGNRGVGVVFALVLDLDLHTPEALAVPPLQNEIGRRRCVSYGIGARSQQKRS